FSGNSMQSALERAKHAAVWRGIGDEYGAGAALDPSLNQVGMMAQDDNHGARDFAEQSYHAVQKSFALIWKKGFRGSHAAGSAGAKNDGGDRALRLHLRSARSLSLAKIDLESERQSESGARRMAIISATIETAISSGVMAPISKPIGENVRSRSARGM